MSLYNQYTYVTILILIDGFLQYNIKNQSVFIISHNPYFNRWFSAIEQSMLNYIRANSVTILILIDGFLQLRCLKNID